MEQGTINSRSLRAASEPLKQSFNSFKLSSCSSTGGAVLVGARENASAIVSSAGPSMGSSFNSSSTAHSCCSGFDMSVQAKLQGSSEVRVLSATELESCRTQKNRHSLLKMIATPN